MKTQSADQNWLKNIHPEDMRATVRSIAGSRRSGSLIDVRYRVADSQGSWAWKRAMGAPRFDVNGNIVCWYGSVQDIDAQSKLFRTIPPEDHGAVKVATNIHVMRLPDEIRSREDLRQEALLDLEILDTPAEAEYDDLVALASEICGTPISLVTLIDSDRQWFKASIGLAKCETPIPPSAPTPWSSKGYSSWRMRTRTNDSGIIHWFWVNPGFVSTPECLYTPARG
jgi:hypothetical protein